MHALTICQPWAWAICEQVKLIENRRWKTPHRGLLLIHAGKSHDFLQSVVEDGLGNDWPVPAELVFGALIGAVDLYDCQKLSEVRGKPFAEGPWCFLFRHVRKFPKPIPLRGEQGIFRVDDSLVPHQWLKIAN